MIFLSFEFSSISNYFPSIASIGEPSLLSSSNLHHVLANSTSKSYIKFNFKLTVVPFKPLGGKTFKSDFLRMSITRRQSQKIDFSFILPKHTFG